MTSKYNYEIKSHLHPPYPQRYNSNYHEHIGRVCNESCEPCFPHLRAEALVEEAETRAKNTVGKKAAEEARTHWEKTTPYLICTLCEETPATTSYKPILKWAEKQYRGKSVVLCPRCVKGTWVLHGPTEWVLGEIACDQQVTTRTNQWEKEGAARMLEKIEEVRKERSTLEGEDHYTTNDIRLIQQAIDKYTTNARETEILIELQDLCKNDENQDENNGKDRPHSRSMERPFKQRKTAANAQKTGDTTRELSLVWKASKEKADEENKTGKEPLRENQNQNQMQKK
jgi:hypothetical protein